MVGSDGVLLLSGWTAREPMVHCQLLVLLLKWIVVLYVHGLRGEGADECVASIALVHWPFGSLAWANGILR